MDYSAISPDSFGPSLKGIGINLLTQNVRGEAHFLTQCLGFDVFQLSDDFAIIRGCDNIFMLHSDQTYNGHPMITMLPETPPRGGGVEIRAYDACPDTAQSKAEAAGGVVLRAAMDRTPHGLREAFIASPSGYVWVPSVVLKG